MDAADDRRAVRRRRAVAALGAGLATVAIAAGLASGRRDRAPGPTSSPTPADRDGPAAAAPSLGDPGAVERVGVDARPLLRGAGASGPAPAARIPRIPSVTDPAQASALGVHLFGPVRWDDGTAVDDGAIVQVGTGPEGARGEVVAGAFDVWVRPAATYPVQLEVEGRSVATTRVPGAAAGPSALVFPRPVVARGLGPPLHVVGPDGAPVVGATVRVLAATDAGAPVPGPWRSGDDGAVPLEGLGDGDGVELELAAPGYLEARVRLSPEGGGRVELVPAGTLEVEVGGAWREGLTVRWVPARAAGLVRPPGPAEEGVAVAVVRGFGRRDVEAGRGFVVAVDAAIGAVLVEVPLEVSAGGTVRARVEVPEGLVEADVDVEVAGLGAWLDASASEPPQVILARRETGVYSRVLTPAPRGRWRATFRSQLAGRGVLTVEPSGWRVPVQLAPGAWRVEVDVPPPVVLDVSLASAAGAALDDVEVSVERWAPSAPVDVGAPDSPPPDVDDDRSWRAEPRNYAWPAATDRPVRFCLLASTPYRLVARARGHAPVAVVVPAAEPGARSAPVAVVLPKAVPVRVEGRRSGRVVPVGRLSVDTPSWVRSVEVDADGVCAGLPRGRVTGTAWAATPTDADGAAAFSFDVGADPAPVLEVEFPAR